MDSGWFHVHRERFQGIFSSWYINLLFFTDVFVFLFQSTFLEGGFIDGLSFHFIRKIRTTCQRKLPVNITTGVKFAPVWTLSQEGTEFS